jgi:predicted dehydrogenase
MSEAVRAAIVGCGNFAHRHAAHVCREGSVPQLRLYAACDLDAQRAEEFAGAYGIPRWTARVEEVLEDDDIEVVLIVTEPAAHVPLAIQSLRAGKAVFCEKPLSAGAEQRGALREALCETGGRLMCGYCYRFTPVAVRAREAIRPAAFTTALVLNNEPGGRSYLVHNACHAVDTVLSLHEADVTEVSATGTNVPGQAHPGEQFCITLRFADGSLAAIVCGGGSAGAWMPKWYYKSVGRNGRVAEIAPVDGWSLWLDGCDGPQVRCDYHEGHREELRHFAACVRSGEPFAVDVEPALRVDEIIDEAARQLDLSK